MGISQEIELERAPASLERRWAWVERICVLLMLMLLILAVLTVLGRGPLATASIRQPASGVEVSYERVARLRSPQVLELKLGEGALPDGAARSVRLSRQFLEYFSIEHVTPMPVSERALANGGVEFGFDADDGTRRLDSIRIALTADKVGPMKGRITVGPHKRVKLRQFVLP
ncbi:MAG: hypothetical protein K0Q76_2075 [Panacagrimonas sp.]|jgi:hypothetical protein|nr:hypothetical protein [Panacagrimonas sp.]MCC2656967.1 hypothetical protein [Panacagrimonas sp.]